LVALKIMPFIEASDAAKTKTGVVYFFVTAHVLSIYSFAVSF
jgi:hypothetical protein